MTMLTDNELTEYVKPKDKGTKPLVTNLLDQDTRLEKDAAVQPASIDLSVGGIFVPGIPQGKRGSAGHEHYNYAVKPGDTVIIESNEELNIPDDLAAIGFPPSNVAIKGLLMTNPGHIDPGFSGKLSFTLINMSKEEFLVLHGHRIFTLLFFKLNAAAGASYSARNKNQPVHGGVKQETLDLLTKDFLDVDKRARNTVIKNTGYATVFLTILAGLLTIGIQWYVDHSESSLNGKVSDLETSFKSMQSKNQIQSSLKSLVIDLEALKKEGENRDEKINSILESLNQFQ